PLQVPIHGGSSTTSRGAPGVPAGAARGTRSPRPDRLASATGAAPLRLSPAGPRKVRAPAASERTPRRSARDAPDPGESLSSPSVTRSAVRAGRGSQSARFTGIDTEESTVPAGVGGLAPGGRLG